MATLVHETAWLWLYKHASTQVLEQNSLKKATLLECGTFPPIRVFHTALLFQNINENIWFPIQEFILFLKT